MISAWQTITNNHTGMDFRAFAAGKTLGKMMAMEALMA